MKRPAARIFYFEKDKVPLLLGAVAPFVQQWRALGDESRIWLKVHWRQGPHLDIISDMDEERFDTQLMPMLRPAVNSWLTAHPSRTVLDPQEYQALSEKLALYELESGSLTPLAKNNTLVRTAHEPSLDIFGVDELITSQEQYSSNSLDHLIHLARIKENNVNTFYLELIKQMALTGTLVRVHGLPRTFVSYRAHSEYFFANHDPTGGIRKQIDSVDAQLGPEIDRIVADAQQVFLGEQDVGRRFPELADWYQGCTRLSQQVYDIAERNADFLGQDNRLGTFADDLVRDLDVSLDPEKARKTSEVEEYFGDMADVFSQVPHIAYRTMVNYFYGLLPILSVPPIQKYSLCHLISNSCERVFQKSWRQVVDEGRARKEIGG